jgi:DNA-binding HxlR family transcriptional regulator
MTVQIPKKPLSDLMEDYLEIIGFPQVVLHPYRLVILKILAGHGPVEFRELKRLLDIKEDGNLASHLKILEAQGYVSYEKQFVGRKPRTIYAITPKGLEGFFRLQRALGKWSEHEE